MDPSPSLQAFTPGQKNPLYDWYHPNMTRGDCNVHFKVLGLGTFVVRDSQATPGWHMLCVKTAGSVLHDKIRMTDDGWELLPTTSDGHDGARQPIFDNLPELLDFYTSARSGVGYTLVTAASAAQAAKKAAPAAQAKREAAAAQAKKEAAAAAQAKKATAAKKEKQAQAKREAAAAQAKKATVAAQAGGSGGADDFTPEEQLEIAEGEYMDSLERANAVLGDIATSYKTTYSTFMAVHANVAGRDKLGSLAAMILVATVGSIAGLKHEILQPDFGIDATQKRPQYMMKAKKEFQLNMPGTDKMLQAYAYECNAMFEMGPPKGKERWLEKARVSYENMLRRVTDIVRRSLIFDSFDDMCRALQMIHDSGIVIIRIKNRFDKKNSVAKDTGAYRDVQLLCFAVGTEMMFEVQLHLRCIHDLKEANAEKVDAQGRTGHERYIEFRQIKETAVFDFEKTKAALLEM